MLTIEGAVNLTVDDVAARFVARGRELYFECDDLKALLRLVGGAAGGGGNGGSGGPLKMLRLGAVQLARHGLTLQVFSRGRLLLVLGEGARPGLAERFLGIPHVQFGSGSELMRLLTQ